MGQAPEFDRAGRDQAFGYDCHRCLRCCRHKRIQLNPYEVARMARNRGLSTTEFRVRHTVEGRGVELSQAPTGDCVFLGPEGCTVHPDRPLVCRLYPLGRFVGADGTERFGRAKPHPESRGVYHDKGSISDFLDQQGVEAFARAADDYMAWLNTALNRLGAATGLSGDEMLEPVGGDDGLMDLDAVLEAHCAASGTPQPVDIEARRLLHLEILYEKLPREEGDSHGA
jgi:Fe-S-cluster containining protein